MEKIFIKDAPKPAGHYAPAVRGNGLLYVSGQLPVDPISGAKCAGDIEEQTCQCLSNLRFVLEAAGTSPERVLRVTIYLSDIAWWDRVNTLYADFFGAHRPARTIVPCHKLHFGFDIELDAIAEMPEEGRI